MENKPCPFCGNAKPRLDSRLNVEQNKVSTLYCMRCPECMVSTAEYESSFDAITAWNRRMNKEMDQT